MDPTFVPYAAALAAANLLALGAMRAVARPRPVEVRETTPTLEDDPLEALVREVETAESASRFGAPGEARLAEDIRRWRSRYAGGDPLPLAAGGGRGRRGTRA